jgi:hypothetical protein
MRLLWIPVLLALFASTLLFLRLGWTAGRRRLEKLGESANEGLGAVDGAVYGLMGLLLAFTFTGAASRFDQRRDLIVQETNAIGTAWLRLDLLQEGPRQQARDLLRRYLDQRLDVYSEVTNRARLEQSLAAVAALQGEIWKLAIAQSREDKSQPIGQLLLPALNDMFDIATSRVLATRQHPHPAIFGMLLALVLVSCFLLGFSQAKVTRQSRMHLVGFAATTALALYIIFDLEYQRIGLIRVDNFDQALVEQRASMD